MKRALVVALVALFLALLPSRPAEAVAGLGPISLPIVTSPGDIADLLLDLRADQVVSPTNGAKFSQWKDLANGGATYTQATSSFQFSWNASDPDFGGQPSVASVAASFVITTALFPAQPFTVYEAVSATPPGGTIVFACNVGDTFEVGLTSNQYYIYSPLISGGTFTSGPHVTASVVNSASSAVYKDASSNAVVSGTVTSNPSGTAVIIGYNLASDGIVGNLAEVLIYSGAHTLAQRSQVFTYLGQRYGHGWN